VRVTHAASPLAPSFLTFTTDAEGSYFFYPLLGVSSGRPVGAVNAVVPYIRAVLLSAYDFHRQLPRSERDELSSGEEVLLRTFLQKLCLEKTGDVL
jgi:hypothetical protein